MSKGPFPLDNNSYVNMKAPETANPQRKNENKRNLSLDSKSELIVAQAFRRHGELCASHPWEVIVATLTLTICMLTVESETSNSLRRPPPPRRNCASESCIDIEDYNAIDMIVMTLIRCIAVLYSYYQFCNLHKLGSKYILGIAGLFTVFSSFVFSSTVINFLGNDISDLKDALFFFLLVIDLPKATVLAQFALSSRSHDEVRSNIAKGMALLGPTITLDTLVEALVIGVGTLSGVARLEVLCCFACMSVIVNYVVFMTFYPACLSLILELSRAGANGQPSWHDKSFLMRALQEEDQKPNPVVQRVKIIMSAGLMLVHAHSHWSLASVDGETHSTNHAVPEQMISTNGTDDSPLPGYIIKWLTLSADHIVILILLLALAVKFIVFEGKDEITEHILMSEREEHIAATVTHEPGQTPVLDSILRQKFAPEHMQIRYATEAAAATKANKSQQMNKDKAEMENTDGSDDDWLEMNISRLPQIITSEDKQIQTDIVWKSTATNQEPVTSTENSQEESEPRDIEECLNIFRDDGDTQQLTDGEVESLVRAGHIPAYQLEKACGDPERGVRVRRKLITSSASLGKALDKLPYTNYDYSLVMGACCENVVGYMPVPVGIAGPIRLDGRDVWVPMATTEGCLVASTTRGSRALYKCGVTSRIVNDGMTRGPVVRFPSLARSSEAMLWMENPDHFDQIKESFNSTSRFAQLKKIHIRIAGRHLFIRFVATTGDAMGMNMVSKGSEAALKMIQDKFKDMEILSLSGNICTDKKSAAINWVEGRGKSVVCEAVVPQVIVRNILKTSVHALVDTNIAKNLVGSAMAGSLGGYNAHAANIVTAIFIATGQDPAQNVSSSSCITLMEPWGDDGEDLYVSCTMPSIEIGTIGGGTVLSSQGACLDVLGVRGANMERPGENACQLARIVCAAVLAGELSLMSALTAGHLVKSHLKLNRSSTNIASTVVTRKISTSNTLSVKDCRGPIP